MLRGGGGGVISGPKNSSKIFCNTEPVILVIYFRENPQKRNPKKGGGGAVFSKKKTSTFGRRDVPKSQINWFGKESNQIGTICVSEASFAGQIPGRCHKFVIKKQNCELHHLRRLANSLGIARELGSALWAHLWRPTLTNSLGIITLALHEKRKGIKLAQSVSDWARCQH